MGYDLFKQVSEEDKAIASSFIGSLYRDPDLIIAPDGSPYLYRWHVTPYNHFTAANVLFHMQVQSDPERPLHDHPWDNMSVILSGGYKEILDCHPGTEHSMPLTYRRVKGQAIFRHSTWAHRLILPADVPYVMTLFSSGPKIREWGYWIEGKWVHNSECNKQLPDGRSVWIGPTEGTDNEAHTI